MSSSIGRIFTLTTFGESHGEAIGGIIDGFPAGIAIDREAIRAEMARRRPGSTRLGTARSEADDVRILSGIYEGVSTGAPIGFMIENTSQISSHYAEIAHKFRPGHADYTFQMKYGIRDPRGGGRSSARETVSRCVAGAIAKQILQQYGVKIYAYTSQIGNICLDKDYRKYDPALIESNPVRCPDQEKAKEMEHLIAEVKGKGDTVGGIITGIAKNVPCGLGEPVFDKLHAELGKAMLSINAAKGFEYGDGFDAAHFFGSERNDLFFNNNGKIDLQSNHSGGIQGGISNGKDIYFRVAFKPVATLLMEQKTVDVMGNDTTLEMRGRHDPCVLPRAVPIVEAMTSMTLLDFLLLQKTRE